MLALACTSDQPAASPTATPAPPLDEAALANATYQLEPNQSIKLTDGRYTGQPPVAGAASRATASLVTPRGSGPLDADAAPDSAVVVAYSGGGSGKFYYLSAVLNNAGAPDPAGSILLGDRVVVHSVEIANRQITVQLRMQGPNDPFCCPTLEAKRVYSLDGRDLKLVSQTP